MTYTYSLKVFVLLVLLTTISSFAQDESKIKVLAEEACGCSKNISTSQPKDSIITNINRCITDVIIKDQTSLQVKEMGMLVDSLVTNGKDGDVAGNNKTYTIIVDKDFDDIQAYMFANCKVVKNLMATNNALLDHSMSANEKAHKLYAEGYQYYQEEKFDMAIASYSKAVKLDPKFGFAWDNLGLTYRKKGNYKEAIKCYEKSLELDPQGTMPLQNIAVAYEYLEDYKNASATYEKFIAIHPDNPEGYFGAGRVYYALDEYAKGVDYMFKAYLLYSEIKSPYISDAQQNLQYYYNDLEKKGKLNIFIEAAKNNKVDIR